MLSVVVFPLHVGSSARFSTAGLDMGTQVFLDPVRSLALLLALVVAPPGVEKLADSQVSPPCNDYSQDSFTSQDHL